MASSVSSVWINRRHLAVLEHCQLTADISGMEAATSNQREFEQSCLKVLECYAVRDAAAKSAAPQYSGWLDRIIDVPGLESVHLTSIHGFLIAQGLIRFEFTGRNTGLQYQLSPSGRDSIAKGALACGEDAGSSDVRQSAETVVQAA